MTSSSELHDRQGQSQHVLVIGRSPGVLLGAVDLLRARGYVADATNQVDHVLTHLEEFDVEQLDVVVFGGFVPADSKEQLRLAMSGRNGHLTFVQGLAGIPGLITAQVRGVLGPALTAGDEVDYVVDDRSVRLFLSEPAHLEVQAFWVTSFAPPEPKNASVVVLDAELGAGRHEIRLPQQVPHEASFVAVSVGASVQTFTVGPMPQSVLNLVPRSSGQGSPLPPPAAVNTRSAGLVT